MVKGGSISIHLIVVIGGSIWINLQWYCAAANCFCYFRFSRVVTGLSFSIRLRVVTGRSTSMYMQWYWLAAKCFFRDFLEWLPVSRVFTDGTILISLPWYVAANCLNSFLR